MATFTSAGGTYLLTSSSSTSTGATITLGGSSYAVTNVAINSLIATDDTLFMNRRGEIMAQAGQTIQMPDGSRIVIDDAGNYRIEDKDAKVTYQANRIREFSPYLNASDLLADFVRDLGAIGVANEDILRTPVDLFIHWLIVRAAERDGDPVRDNRCRTCGRFVGAERRRVGACRSDHLALLPPRKPRRPRAAAKLGAA